MNSPRDEHREPAGAPPIFKTWGRWYALVFLELTLIMVVAYVLTEIYR